MKSKILFLFLSLFSIALIGQDGLVSGNLNVTAIPTDNGDGTFTVTGTFTDPKGQYFAADVDTGMVFWKGNNFYLIDSILTASGSDLTIRVQDTYSTGFIPTGNAQIVELTPNLKLPGVSTTGDSNAALATPPDYAALLNYIIQRIDIQLGSGGSGNGYALNDIWYVSEDGDNNTAIKGDPASPCRDLWAARDSAQVGDVIFVFVGNYTSGSIGSGATREFDGTDLEASAINKDSVLIYLSEGAVVKNTATVLMPLIYDTTGQYIKIEGSGEIQNLDSRARIAYIDNSESNIYVNLSRITNGENAASWSYGFFVLQFKNIQIETNLLEVSNSRFFNFQTEIVENASLRIHADRFNIGNISDQVFKFDRSGKLVKSKVDIELGLISGNPKYDIFFEGVALDSSVINFRIGSAQLTGFEPNFSFLSFPANNGATIKNSTISVHCNNCQTDAAIFALGRSNGANENSKFIVTGNYYTTSQTRPLALVSAQQVNIPIYFSGNFSSLNTPVVQKANEANLHLSGIFQTYADTCVIYSSSIAGRTTLGNVQLIKPAGVNPVIVSTNLDTFNVYSAFTNQEIDTTNLRYKRLNEYGYKDLNGIISELPLYDVDIDANENSLSIDSTGSITLQAKRAAGTAVSRFTLGSTTTLPITFSNENPADANDRARVYMDWDGVSGIGLGASGTRLDFSTDSQPVLLGPGGNNYTYWPDSAHFDKRLIIEEGAGPELTLRRPGSLTEMLFDGFSQYRIRGGVTAWQFQNAATNSTIFQMDADAPLSLVIEDDSTIVFSQYASSRPYDLFSVRGQGEAYFDGTGRLRKKPMGSGNYDAPSAGTLTNDYQYIELGFSGTYTLPDPTTNKGKVYTLIADSATDAGGNARSIAVAAGGLIEGNPTLTLDNAYEVYELVSSGTEYIILYNKP